MMSASTKVSRRQFLEVSGTAAVGLVIAFSLPEKVVAKKAAPKTKAIVAVTEQPKAVVVAEKKQSAIQAVKEIKPGKSEAQKDISFNPKEMEPKWQQKWEADKLYRSVIDEIVKYVRFDGWQDTQAGEREVKVLRKTLFNYKSHHDRGIPLIKDLGDC